MQQQCQRGLGVLNGQLFKFSFGNECIEKNFHHTSILFRIRAAK
jgi:hypothetical protein